MPLASFSVCPYAVSIIRIRQTPKKPGESDDSTEPGIIKRFARTLGACSGLVFGSHKKDEETTDFRTEPYLQDVRNVTNVPKTPSTPAARPVEVAEVVQPAQPAVPVEVVRPARPSIFPEFPQTAVTRDASFVEPARTEPETSAEETKTEDVPAVEPAPEIRVERESETQVETKADVQPDSQSEAPHKTQPEAAEPREVPVEEPPEEPGNSPTGERAFKPIEMRTRATTTQPVDTFEEISDVNATEPATSTSAPAVESTDDEPRESDKPAKFEEPEVLAPIERLRAALRAEDLEQTIVASLGGLDLSITRPLGNEMLDLALASDCPLLEVWTRYIVMRGSTERSASSSVWTEMLVSDIRNNRISDLVRHLSYGANPNAKIQMPGEPTAIEIALESGHKPLAEKLLDWGACIPESAAFPLFRRATARRLAGKTPDKLPDEFMLAAAMGNQPLVMEFLSRDVSPGARSAQGRTAADFARLAGHTTLASFLENLFAEYVKQHPEQTRRPAEAIRAPVSARKVEPAVDFKPEPRPLPAVEPKPEPQPAAHTERTGDAIAPTVASRPPVAIDPVESDDSDDFGLDDFGLDDLGLDDLIPDAPDSDDANRPGTSILTSTRDVQRRHAGEISAGPAKRLGDGASGTADLRTEVEIEPKIEIAPEPIAVAEPASAATEHEDSDDDYRPDRSDNYGRIVHVAPADRSALYERWTVAHWASIGERIFLRALKSLPVDEAVKADFIAIQRDFAVSDADADANGEAFRMLKLYCDDLIDPNTFR